MANNATYIEFAIDQSGSMSSCSKGTIEGFNAFIDEQKSIEGECYVTLTKFNTEATTIYQNIRVAAVPKLDFSPMGGTALYDAIEQSISRLNTVPADKRLLVIFTDGMDNASKASFEATKIMVSSAIQNGIDILFYGESNGVRMANELGIPTQNAIVFDTQNIQHTMVAASSYTKAYRMG